MSKSADQNNCQKIDGNQESFHQSDFEDDKESVMSLNLEYQSLETGNCYMSPKTSNGKIEQSIMKKQINIQDNIKNNVGLENKMKSEATNKMNINDEEKFSNKKKEKENYNFNEVSESISLEGKKIYYGNEELTKNKDIKSLDDNNRNFTKENLDENTENVNKEDKIDSSYREKHISNNDEKRKHKHINSSEVEGNQTTKYNSSINNYIDENTLKLYERRVIKYISYIFKIIQTNYNLKLSCILNDSLYEISINDYETILEMKLLDFILGRFSLINNEGIKKAKNEIELLLKEKKEDYGLIAYFSIKIREINEIYKKKDYPSIISSKEEIKLCGFETFREDLNIDCSEEKIFLEDKTFNNIQLNNQEKNTKYIGFESSQLPNSKIIFEIIKNQKKDLTELKENVYNERRRLIKICLQSITDVIRNLYRKIINGKLQKVYIKKQIKYSFEDYRKFANKYLFDIYCDFLPKNFKKDKRIIMNCKEKNKYNEKFIKIFII